jgi:hypothetical protein
MRSEAEFQARMLWLRYTYSYFRVKVALLDLELHLFNPGQPRVPAGRPDGGQRTDGDGVTLVADDDHSGNDRYLNPHIMDRHVGKSDAELIARIRRSQYHGWFTSAGRDRNGTFASVEAARDFIKRTIDNNPEAVSRVVSGQSQYEFLTWRFGHMTGREAIMDSPDSDIIRMRVTYNVGVLIVPDPNSEFGYRVHTAYPRNYNVRIGR